MHANSANLAKAHSNLDHACLDACVDCSGSKCCGAISYGGLIEPPFLTTFDIIQIEKGLGLNPDAFSDLRLNPNTGNKVRFLKTNPNGGCGYLDSGRCIIHSFRPVDCRLFPMDIRKLDGENKWVLYHFQHCELSESDLSLLKSQMPPALTILGNEVDDYASVPVPGMINLRYMIISSLQKDAVTGGA